MALDRELPAPLDGKTVAFVGKLASMPRRDAAQLVRRYGGAVAEQATPEVDLIVLGEQGLSLALDESQPDGLDPTLLAAAERGTLEIVGESQFWQRLGLVESQQDVHQLYTPAALAKLLGVPVTVIRRWHRHGLIVPVREVRRLAYFDFQEVATARRLAELLAAGMSPRAIEKKLAALARWLPQVQRPLAQLSVIVHGKEILLRQGDGLIEPGGQLRFDFEAADLAPEPAPSPPCPDLIPLVDRRKAEAELSPRGLCSLAAELEDDGQLEAAIETYHAAMAAGGPTAEICFQVAELLYRLGDLSGARERYFMAIELDENFVEARANLGCILAEQGRHELAVAAFAGALRYHPDYADVHYHLARTLDDMQHRLKATEHWRAFLDLAPNSPWAEEARHRLD